MRGVTPMAFIVVALLSIHGCGGGGSGAHASGNGRLTLRARWEQRGTSSHERTAFVGAPRASSGGFGPTIPADVQSVVIKFRSAAEPAPCCVAVDPTTGAPSPNSTCPVDPNTGPRIVVLGSLPGGPGTVSIFGYPVDPDSAADACQGLQPDMPNYASLPHAVEIIAGEQTDAGDIEVFALTSPSPTPSNTAAATATSSPTPSNTATATATPSPTPSDTATPTATATPAVGVIQGKVVNCLTGAPIGGATVQPVEPMIGGVVSGVDGLFRLADVPFGNFALNTLANGFIDARVTGTLTPARPDQQLTIALCPTGGAGLRIVLTWSSGAPAPADLDAHLRGPAPGTSVANQPVDFHLDFANPTITFPIDGGATLDIDSSRFSGPETETVDQLIAGIYHFCVHDFTDRLASGSQGLTNSDARVRVFLGDAQQAEFLVPSGSGNVWDVFRLDTTQQVPVVIPVNSFTDEVDRERVCRRPDDTDGDGLTDVQEVEVVGTDPTNPDTNANGISDGQDVINGTNPLRNPVQRPR